MIRFRIPFFIPWIFPRRVWKMKSKDAVYLTFDDGPQPEATEWLLGFLQQEEIKATFFCVGENVRRNPELFELIINQGHSIGNHTMNHENGFKISNIQYFESISRANTLIDSKIFRPPYGRLPLWKTNKIRDNYQIIMWSWLSYDFNQNVSLDRIVNNAQKIKAGDILVFHDNMKSFNRLQLLLPQIVKDLKMKGFKFATL